MNVVPLACLVSVNSSISNQIISDKYGGTNSFGHLKSKLHLWAFLCVSKFTHPNILNDSSVLALLSIMFAALFCRCYKLLLHPINSLPHTVSL